MLLNLRLTAARLRTSAAASRVGGRGRDLEFETIIGMAIDRASQATPPVCVCVCHFGAAFHDHAS